MVIKIYPVNKFANAVQNWAKQYNNIFLENDKCFISSEKLKIKTTTHKNIKSESVEISSFNIKTPNNTVKTFHKFSNGINAEIDSCFTTYWLILIVIKNNKKLIKIKK